MPSTTTRGLLCSWRVGERGVLVVSPLHCDQVGLLLDKQLLRVLRNLRPKAAVRSLPTMHGTWFLIQVSSQPSSSSSSSSSSGPGDQSFVPSEKLDVAARLFSSSTNHERDQLIPSS